MRNDNPVSSSTRGPIFAEGVALLLTGYCAPMAVNAALAILGVQVSRDWTFAFQNAGIGVVVVGLCYVAYSPFDRFVVRRGRETRKESWIWAIGMWSLLLAIGLSAAQMLILGIASARRAAESATVIPIKGLPFVAQLPSGWHELPAPAGSQFAVGNQDNSAGIAFSATHLEDLPADYRTPQNALKLWHGGLSSVGEDLKVFPPTPTTLMGGPGLESRVEATTPVPVPVGRPVEKVRFLYVRRVAVNGPYLVQATLWGRPSMVRQLAKDEFDLLLAFVQPAATAETR